MDKVREEFELAWQIIKGRDDEGNLGNKPTRSKIDNDKYAGEAANLLGCGGRDHENLLLYNCLKTAKEML